VRRTVAVVAAAGLVALGCSGGEDEILDLQATPSAETEPTDQPDEPEPDVEDTEEPVDEPEPDDPYAVPDEIDEDYVERVINAILEVQSEVLRGALQQEQGENLDPDLMALHFATTEGEQRLLGMTYLQDYIDDPSSRGSLRDAADIDDMTFEADRLLHVEPNQCVIVAGYLDTSGTSTVEVDAKDPVAFSLSKASDQEERSEGNPTPWLWQSHVLLTDAEGDPIPSDYWEDLDFDGHLDNACEDFSG
jgi:hypothetical protein